MSSKNNTALLIAYFYPPLGGPAVQRPCKTVKYLTKLGWDIDVITIRDIVYHSKDITLLPECTHRNIYRTRSLDPMYILHKLKSVFRFSTDKLYFQTSQSGKNRIRWFFPIDEKIGWIPFVIASGIKAIKANKYSAIIVTCGPFSSSIAAYYLATKFKLPLIIDYRDLWTLNNTVMHTNGLSFKLLQYIEHKLLSRAALVLTATAFMKQYLLDRFCLTDSNKLLPFYNGWDEEDFKDKQVQRKPDGKIRISYLGTLYGQRPISFFMKALKETCNELTGTDIELWMVGNFYPETINEIRNSGLEAQTRYIEQQKHPEAIQLMLDSDILLLIIGGDQNKWILTGKLFEYLRCKKPIITLAAKDSEAAIILRQSGHDAICNYDDPNHIKTALINLINIVQSKNQDYTIPYKYERSHQVEMLNEALIKLSIAESQLHQ